MSNSTPLQKAQEVYDSITAKVMSVKRKLDNGSSVVTYDTLSPLLDEQNRCNEQLEEAIIIAAKQVSMPRSRADLVADENRRVKEERRLANAQLTSMPTQI